MNRLPEHISKPSHHKGVPRIMDLRGTYKGGGGPDKTILNSAAQHDPGKVHVLVTYLRQPWDQEYQIEGMAQRLGINYVDALDHRKLDFGCLTKLKQLLLEHDLRLIHAHDDKSLLYGWLLTCMTPGTKLLYTCHSHSILSRKDFDTASAYLAFKARQKQQIFLMRRCLRPILTVSCDTKTRLAANGLPSNDIAVLPNGIDLSFWKPGSVSRLLRRELGIAPEAPLIGTVARIDQDKDLTTFFKVAEHVARQVGHATFVIVGDGYGNELQRAKEEVARLGLEPLIRFTGHRTDLREVYASFDIFLMTSRSEGMPNTLLEAMAMGIPPVSTSAGGVPEILQDGITGFLSSIGDFGGLATNIIRLIQDPVLMEQMKTACREHITAHFNFSKRVQKMEEYYSWFARLGPLPSTS